jgi:hypothetical protein
VRADIEARVRDSGREQDEERRSARSQHREDNGAGDRRGRMAGRERVAVRDRDERVGLARPVLADEELEEPRTRVGDDDGNRDEHEGRRAAVERREDETEDQPEESVRADPRQEDEDVV